MASTKKYTGSIGVTSLGMVSSLGHDALNACAAARAGLTRITELKCLNFQSDPIFGKETMDGFPMVGGHIVPAVDGFVGVARIVSLGVIALKDLLSNRPLSTDELALTAMHLNLSDHFIQDRYAEIMPEVWGNDEFMPSECWTRETFGVIQKILEQVGISIAGVNHSLYYGGRVGIIQAVSDAIKRIQDSEIDRCIVGCIDSCIEPRFLEAAASLQLLKTGDNPVGFQSGEAGCFFLLERLDRCSTRNNQSQIGICGIAKGWDQKHAFTDKSPTGEGLATVIEEVLSQNTGYLPGLMIIDLNGSDRRAMDWGNALIKLHGKYPIGNLPIWLPVASFGENCAGLGAVAICMAVRAIDRGYAPGNGRILICLSSDNGARGAIVLTSLNS